MKRLLWMVCYLIVLIVLEICRYLYGFEWAVLSGFAWLIANNLTGKP